MTTHATHVISGTRICLLIAIFALGLAAGTQPASATEAACSDIAERYPMLAGSGYEGVPCAPPRADCPDVAARYPMLAGSGYEDVPCAPATGGPVTGSARSGSAATHDGTPSPTWRETMLDGSGYEGHAADTATSRRYRY